VRPSPFFKVSLIRPNRLRCGHYTRGAAANQLDDGIGDTLVGSLAGHFPRAVLALEPTLDRVNLIGPDLDTPRSLRRSFATRTRGPGFGGFKILQAKSDRECASVLQIFGGLYLTEVLTICAISYAAVSNPKARPLTVCTSAFGTSRRCAFLVLAEARSRQIGSNWTVHLDRRPAAAGNDRSVGRAGIGSMLFGTADDHCPALQELIPTYRQYLCPIVSPAHFWCDASAASVSKEIDNEQETNRQGGGRGAG
jgi:hypothetical protein